MAARTDRSSAVQADLEYVFQAFQKVHAQAYGLQHQLHVGEHRVDQPPTEQLSDVYGSWIQLIADLY